MTDFEQTLRQALAAVPHPTHRERQLQRHLDRPDTQRKRDWLDRCFDVVTDGMGKRGLSATVTPAELLAWLEGHWLQILQAILSIASIFFMFMGTEDEHAMMRAEAHAVLDDAIENGMAAGWAPGDNVLDWAIGQAVDRRVVPAVRELIPRLQQALAALDFVVTISAADADVRAFFIKWLTKS